MASTPMLIWETQLTANATTSAARDRAARDTPGWYIAWACRSRLVAFGDGLRLRPGTHCRRLTRTEASHVSAFPCLFGRHSDCRDCYAIWPTAAPLTHAGRESHRYAWQQSAWCDHRTQQPGIHQLRANGRHRRRRAVPVRAGGAGSV